MRLCHRCGYAHDEKPAKDHHEADKAAWAKEREQLLAQLAQRNEIIEKLNTVLDILMTTSEAARLSKVSQINKRRKSGSILASIRKANQND